MHPDIRSFPSAFFYQNRLQDAYAPQDLSLDLGNSASIVSVRTKPAPC